MSRFKVAVHIVPRRGLLVQLFDDGEERVLVAVGAREAHHAHLHAGTTLAIS